MLRGPREDAAKIVHTIKRAAERGACLSAKMLLKAAHEERLLNAGTERLLVSKLNRCYGGR